MLDQQQQQLEALQVEEEFKTSANSVDLSYRQSTQILNMSKMTSENNFAESSENPKRVNMKTLSSRIKSKKDIYRILRDEGRSTNLKLS